MNREPADDFAPTSGARQRENAYRRLLRWYPRDFRSEYEQEMLGVLMTVADNRRAPDWRERLNLMSSGLLARMRPNLPRSAHTVRTALGLIYGAAVLQTAALLVFLTTAGTMRSNILRVYPNFTSAMWDRFLDVQFIPRAVFGALAVVVCLVLAQKIGRGRDLARQVYLLFFGVATIGLLIALGEGATVYAPADVAVAAPLWFLELSIVILLFNRRSEPYFSRKKHAPTSSGDPDQPYPPAEHEPGARQPVAKA